MTPEAALLAYLSQQAPTENDRWLVSMCSSPVEAMALAIRMASNPSPFWRTLAVAVALYSQEPTYTIDRGVSVECVCRTDRRAVSRQRPSARRGRADYCGVLTGGPRTHPRRSSRSLDPGLHALFDRRRPRALRRARRFSATGEFS